MLWFDPRSRSHLKTEHFRTAPDVKRTGAKLALFPRVCRRSWFSPGDESRFRCALLKRLLYASQKMLVDNNLQRPLKPFPLELRLSSLVHRAQRSTNQRKKRSLRSRSFSGGLSGPKPVYPLRLDLGEISQLPGQPVLLCGSRDDLQACFVQALFVFWHHSERGIQGGGRLLNAIWGHRQDRVV